MNVVVSKCKNLNPHEKKAKGGIGRRQSIKERLFLQEKMKEKEESEKELNIKWVNHVRPTKQADMEMQGSGQWRWGTGNASNIESECVGDPEEESTYSPPKTSSHTNPLTTIPPAFSFSF